MHTRFNGIRTTNLYNTKGHQQQQLTNEPTILRSIQEWLILFSDAIVWMQNIVPFYSTSATCN